MDLPLQQIRVADISSYLTGPFAAMMLADLGAEVVKVERPPKGDPLRGIGHRFRGQSVQYLNVNRNKRSIQLNFCDPEDRAALLGLLASTDVLIQNWRPGVAESLGLGDDVLVGVNPKLVRLSITGYGPDGPLASRPAFDSLLQAQTGLAHRQRDGERPEPVRAYVADKVTSALAVQAVLAALLGRSVTGQGERIEISMLDALSYFNFPDLMEDRTFLADPAGRTERPRSRSFVVETADGYLVVAPGTGLQVRAALEAVGHPEWQEELRAITDPLAMIATLMDRLESVTVNAKTSIWLERFAAADVPAAPVLDFDGHLADPQVIHNRIYHEYQHPEFGPMRYPRYPARFAGAPKDPGGAQGL